MSERAAPAILPIFPLPGLVALPGSQVGFHFFEPRYRAMARDLVGDGDASAGVRELVLAEVVQGEDARRDDCALHPIASVARVVASEVQADGTMDVLLAVHARVRLREVDRGALLYRRAEVEVLEDLVRDGAALEATGVSLRACARELVEIERELGGGEGVRFDGHPSVLADRLADRYFRRIPELRRQVLETLDVLARGELVLEHVAKILNAIRSAQGGAAN
ncbi:MAG: LON peptidase substrate-binding domain-containing protein [Deltaproteobacteria bacterium]|nr:LON peptidase substrate-binding domain-containing protein [Deltaproteobacteria bacterium]